jgi:hypothetical protein
MEIKLNRSLRRHKSIREEILQTTYLLAKCYEILQHTCEKNISITLFRKVWTFLP